MEPDGVSWDAQATELVQEIRDSSLENLQSLASEFLSLDALLVDYIAALNDRRKSVALKACLIVHIVSKYRIIPRKFQLEAVLALDDGRDVILESGTGSGKTLCLIIPNLLYPNMTSITISPLKRLQILQAAELEEWGIKTICINEDTPGDMDLWAKLASGFFQHIIAQPEQLKIFNGHLPRFCKLLNDSNFVKTISRMNVDESHSIHTAGLPLYGLPPFRPAWGALNVFRLRLRKGTPVLAMSATLPLHIKATVLHNLNFDSTTMLSLELSTSRPNIIYATHRIVGSLADFRNLDFPLSDPFTRPRKTLIFHDSTHQCSEARAYHNKRLPPELQSQGLVRHYHAGMSKAYLTQVFDDFAKEDGMCRILHTTEGLSTGLHVADVEAVVDYGAPRAMPTSIQRAGRAGRRGQPSVYLLMAEPWVYTASLESADARGDDPDRPISGKLLKNSKKYERAGLAVIQYVRSRTCLREMLARYLSDSSREALKISTEWCCDRPHEDDNSIQFDKRSFFPGRFIYEDDAKNIYAGDTDEPDRVHLNPPKAKKPRPNGKKNRKVADRGDLQIRLHNFAIASHATDPLRAVRPLSFILDSKSIQLLSAAHPDCMRSPDDVVTALEEAPEWRDEWAAKIFRVISMYDDELVRQNTTISQRAAGGGKESRKAGDLEEDSDWRPQEKRQKSGAPLADVSINVRRSSRLALAGKK